MSCCAAIGTGVLSLIVTWTVFDREGMTWVHPDTMISRKKRIIIGTRELNSICFVKYT
jgi:hypothetical protein